MVRHLLQLLAELPDIARMADHAAEQIVDRGRERQDRLQAEGPRIAVDRFQADVALAALDPRDGGLGQTDQRAEFPLIELSQLATPAQLAPDRLENVSASRSNWTAAP